MNLINAAGQMHSLQWNLVSYRLLWSWEEEIFVLLSIRIQIIKRTALKPDLPHVPSVTQLEHCPWVSGTLHRTLFTKCPLLALYSHKKSVSCSHKPKAKNQNGLLKPRLSFLLLEEKSTAAKSVDTAMTRRETFHKTGFVCNNQWGKGKQAESQLRGSRSSHPSKLILQAPEKQVQQEHNYYNTVSVAQSS